jgi:hypothetical protein
VQMSRLLLQLGADVNAADSYGTTPLAAAARRGLSLQVPLHLSLCFICPSSSRHATLLDRLRSKSL